MSAREGWARWRYPIGFLVAMLTLALAPVVLITTWAPPAPDPARIGVSAILATEECGRAWAIEQRPHGDYRITNIPVPHEGFLSADLPCVEQGPREVMDLCGRRFLMQPIGNHHARLQRAAPRYPAEPDERCPS